LHVPEITKALRVGPESAGIVPGPACYGKGGSQATVSDANAALGYLPQYLLGGAFKLDLDAAKRAVQKLRMIWVWGFTKLLKVSLRSRMKRCKLSRELRNLG
jgi:N-methylhydantoinase A/oxoprolinase/acetone carboxylase beta subunit